jgi:hypothetical protein
MEDKYRIAKIAIDGDSSEAIEGYTDDSHWNGWLNVYVNLENLLQWLESSPYDHRILDNGDVLVYFEEEETFTRTSIELNDEFIPVYDMHSYCFLEVDND